jgi:phospholipid/cholesterol/gamma-HCH transport system permease protein
VYRVPFGLMGTRVISGPMAQVDRLGAFVLGHLLGIWQVLALLYLSVRSALFGERRRSRAILGVVAAQVYFTGFQALPLVSVLALASGSAVIMQASSQLVFFGGHEMLGSLLVIIIVREVAPLLTALIVIARSGTAVASEMANMRVNREIEALEVMGINPLGYTVFPRLAGGVVSVLCLAFYFVLVALLVGFFVTKLTHDLPFAFYTDSLAAAVSPIDVWLFLLKNLVGGILIFGIACQQGLQARQSVTEVPQVTTRAVVQGIVYVTVFNLGVTTWLYLEQLTRMGVV